MTLNWKYFNFTLTENDELSDFLTLVNTTLRLHKTEPLHAAPTQKPPTLTPNTDENLTLNNKTLNALIPLCIETAKTNSLPPVYTHSTTRIEAAVAAAAMTTTAALVILSYILAARIYLSHIKTKIKTTMTRCSATLF